MTSRFDRVLYRARDVDAARAFYKAVLGDQQFEVVPLPAAAAERGAPAHWLGAIGVDDVAKTAADFVARGATALGPLQQDAQGSHAVVRDPGGAAIALATASPGSTGPTFAWSHLDARDAAATFGIYADLFGWQSTTAIDVGAGFTMMQFAWTAGGPNVGTYADVALRPNHHPMWLFHFKVPSLAKAEIAVRNEGGVVLVDSIDARRQRTIICDDPQTAGFALCE